MTTSALSTNELKSEEESDVPLLRLFESLVADGDASGVDPSLPLQDSHFDSEPDSDWEESPGLAQQAGTKRSSPEPPFSNSDDEELTCRVAKCSMTFTSSTDRVAHELGHLAQSSEFGNPLSREGKDQAGAPSGPPQSKSGELLARLRHLEGVVQNLEKSNNEGVSEGEPGRELRIGQAGETRYHAETKIHMTAATKKQLQQQPNARKYLNNQLETLSLKIGQPEINSESEKLLNREEDDQVDTPSGHSQSQDEAMHARIQSLEQLVQKLSNDTGREDLDSGARSPDGHQSSSQNLTEFAGQGRSFPQVGKSENSVSLHNLEFLYCHSCEMTSWRSERDLECSRCHSGIVEIVSEPSVRHSSFHLFLKSSCATLLRISTHTIADQILAD